ncbi:coiled-coil domain-containing protein [Piscirickettsia litoralis]|nr:hypothetical protein [Piscirickettsia litoralis]
MAAGYAAMVKLSQITNEMVKLSRAMYAHIRAETAATAAPFSLTSSLTTKTILERFYLVMEQLKKEADRIYNEEASPLIMHLEHNRRKSRKTQPAYDMATDVKTAKEGLDEAYRSVQKYRKMSEFQQARARSEQTVEKMNQQVDEVAKKYPFIDEGALPEFKYSRNPNYDGINRDLSGKLQDLADRYNAEEFKALAMQMFADLLTDEDSRLQFNVRSSDDLVRLRGIAEEFIPRVAQELSTKRPQSTNPFDLPVVGPGDQERESSAAVSAGDRDWIGEDNPEQHSDTRHHAEDFLRTARLYAAQVEETQQGSVTVSQLLEELNRVKEENHQYRVAARANEVTVEGLQRKAAAHVAKAEDLQERIDELEAKVAAISESLDASQAELEAARISHETSSGTVAENFEKLKQMVIGRSQKIEKDNASIVDELYELARSVPDQAKFDKFSQRMVQLHKEQVDFLDFLKKELEKAAEHHKHNSEEVTGLIAKASVQVDLANARLREVQEKLDDMREQVVTLTRDLEDARATIRDLQAQIAAMNPPPPSQDQSQEATSKESHLTFRAKGGSSVEVDSVLTDPIDNITRTRNLIKIIETTLKEVEAKEGSENKRKYLRDLVDQLKAHNKTKMSDDQFKKYLKSALGIACQNRSGRGRKKETNTGHKMIELINNEEKYPNIRTVIPGTGKIDFKNDILKGFLKIEAKYLESSRIESANLRSGNDKGNLFYAEFAAADQPSSGHAREASL